MMLAKLVSPDDVQSYDKVLAYGMEAPLSKNHNAMDYFPDCMIIELDEDEIDPDVEDYLNGFDKVAISRTNCPICGEDYFNGWRCDCLSPDAQTKFQWRYK